MNQNLEDAIISNLMVEFPLSNVYTGRIVQNAQPDDISIYTAIDEITVLSSNVRQRHSMVSVLVIDPTIEYNELIDKLYNCLQSFSINGSVHLPETFSINNDEGVVRILVSITYKEVTK